LISFLVAVAVAFAAHAAHAAIEPDLQRFPSLHGTYAPAGDCSREPRVTVDDSGFIFTWHGKISRSRIIHWVASFMGRGYQGITKVFNPFAINGDDWGPLTMTFNPDEHAGRLEFEPNLAKGQSPTLLQAALVKASPYGKCDDERVAAELRKVAAMTAATQRKIDFGKDRIAPTRAQIANVVRAAGGALRGNCVDPQWDCYRVVLDDLDDDGRADMLVYYCGPGFCDSSGCTGAIVMATSQGHAATAIRLPKINGGIDILRTVHHGMHDLHNNRDERSVWRWNGRRYVVVPQG
jgi:hypothetical protein